MGFISSLLGAKNNATAANIQGISPDQAANNANQDNLARALTASMNGQGPSLAQQQLANATAQNINTGAGQIASVKGINPGLAAKMALDNTANQNATAAGQSAEIRNQEQLQARGQLENTLTNTGNNLSAQRGQDIQGQLGTEQINAGVAGQNASTNAGIGGGLISSAGSVLSMPKLAGGGFIGIPDFGNQGDYNAGASIGKGISSVASAGKSKQDDSSGAGSVTDESSAGPAMAGEAGEAGGLDIGALAALAAKGMVVPGKAKVKGDSKKNDVVPAILSPGEVVIPRSKAKDPEMAKEFIEALQKNKVKKESSGGYAKVLKAHQDMHNRISNLEAMCYGGMSK